MNNSNREEIAFLSPFFQIISVLKEPVESVAIEFHRGNLEFSDSSPSEPLLAERLLLCAALFLAFIHRQHEELGALSIPHFTDGEFEAKKEKLTYPDHRPKKWWNWDYNQDNLGSSKVLACNHSLVWEQTWPSG